MANDLAFFVAIDQDYYPDVEVFEDEVTARDRFTQLAADFECEGTFPQNSSGDGIARLYFGVVLRSHPLGHRLVRIEDW